MNYLDILDANNLILKKDIKGKQYGEVAERIKAFKYLYPEGRIDTQLLSNQNGVCIFKASVYNNYGDLLGTGHAQEKEGNSFINNTSYIENCETSAVGRALGMAGFAINTIIMSYEELSNAELQQELLKPITSQQLRVLQGLIKQCDEKRIAYDSILSSTGVDDLQKLTRREYGEILSRFGKKMDDENKSKDN